MERNFVEKSNSILNLPPIHGNGSPILCRRFKSICRWSPFCKLLPSSASQQRPWCWWVSALLRKQIYSGPLLLLVTATHLVTLSQVIKTALGRSRNPLICRLTKIFSFSDRGSQTESVTCQIKMPLRRKKHFLSRNLRFANSTEWRKLGRGIGRGEGHLRPPGFHLKVLLGSFHLKVLRESFPLKLFAGKLRKEPGTSEPKVSKTFSGTISTSLKSWKSQRYLILPDFTWTHFTPEPRFKSQRNTFWFFGFLGFVHSNFLDTLQTGGKVSVRVDATCQIDWLTVESWSKAALAWQGLPMCFVVCQLQFGIIWYCIVLYCIVWFGMVWYGILIGMVWYGVVWW